MKFFSEKPQQTKKESSSNEKEQNGFVSLVSSSLYKKYIQVLGITGISLVSLEVGASKKESPMVNQREGSKNISLEEKSVDTSGILNRIGFFFKKKEPLLDSIYQYNGDFYTRKFELKRFKSDPALNILRELEYTDHAPKCIEDMNLSFPEKMELIMHVARNLMSEGVPVTRENFEIILYKTLKLKTSKEILKMKLFENKSVLFLAGMENLFINDVSKKLAMWELGEEYIASLGDNRFGTKPMIDSIKNQNVESLRVFRVKTESGADSVKREFLSSVETISNLTLFFDNHGDNDRQYITNNTFITDKEFFQSLKKRKENGLNDAPLCIYASCLSFDFTLKVCERLKKYNRKKKSKIPLPITITSAEFGQFGISDKEFPAGSVFNQKRVPPGRNASIAGIVSAKEFEDKTIPKRKQTNVSVLVPVLGYFGEVVLYQIE